MQVVVLIGGLGTRLYPLTYTTPKSLLPIANRRFLDLECQWLLANGVTDLVVAVSHFAAPIMEFLEESAVARGLNIKMRMEERPLGSGGALKNCADILEDSFLLLNGDILMDLDLGDLREFHASAGAVVTATASKVDDPRHWGILDIQNDGRTLGWQEKPTPEEAKSCWGNVGAWAMSRQILDHIPEGRFVSLEKETFPILFDQGLPFYGYRFSGYWKDIGTIDKYVQANRDLLAGSIHGLTPTGKEDPEGVWIDETAHVADDVELVPPAVLGPDCRIGPGAKIHGPTVIGSGAQIGAGATISSTIVWPKAKVADRTAIHDSVIGEAEIGPECTLGADCAIASNTIVGGGQEIPDGTRLGPGSRLHGG